MIEQDKEIKASAILELLGTSVLPDDIVLVDTICGQRESVVYVEFLERYLDDEDISWREFPFELWDDEPPYPKTLAYAATKKVKANFDRIAYLEKQIEMLKTEILMLQKESGECPKFASPKFSNSS